MTSVVGIPLKRPRETLVWTSLLFVYYLLTMSRGLSMYDSPELAMVAAQLGLGHPPGQPVHTMTGWLWATLASLVQLDARIALNALSAAAGALCLVPAIGFAEAIIDYEAPERTVAPRVVIPAIALMGLHTALWEPATRIEVYSLACLFSLWAIACLAHALREPTAGSKRFLIVGLCTGLAAATHPHFGFATAVALAPRIVLALTRREIRVADLFRTILGGVIGLLPYLYVPLVARDGDVFVWGDPSHAEALVRYFTGAEFSHNRVITPTSWAEHVRLWTQWAVETRILFLLLTGLVGHSLFCKRRVLGRLPYNMLLIYFVALVTSNTRFAPDVLDYLEYLMIVSWLAAVGSALVIAHVWSRKNIGGVGVAILLTLFLLVPERSSFFRTRRLDLVTDQVAARALEHAPENAIVLVEHDHWVAPLWYLQEQENIRPDVVVLAYGLTGSTWYWGFLYQRHPALHRIALRAPGGRPARVRRFLQAHRDRPLQIERAALAHEIGVPTCPSDWLLDVRSRCPERTPISSLARYVDASLTTLHDGSPGTDGLLALIAFDRGHDLWTMGWPRAAVQTLLMGVPGDPVPPDEIAQLEERSQPAWRLRPDYDPPVALGHPARNLHLASIIAREVGAATLASELEALSHEAGPVTPKIAGDR